MRAPIQKFLLILVACVVVGSCASKKGAGTDGSEIVAPREPTPIDPKNPPKLRIEGLAKDELLKGARSVTIHVEGYEMAEGWQGLEVAINDQNPQRFYTTPLSFPIPMDKLRKGPNLIRAYLVRSWGESVKPPSAFAFVPFFFESKTGLSWVAPQRPIVTLVSPRGIYKGEAAKKILFDFMVKNPEGTSKQYKVHYTLNGKKLELTSGESYYFYNLVPRDYELRVEVVNNRGIPLGQEVTRSRGFFTVVGDGSSEDNE